MHTFTLFVLLFLSIVFGLRILAGVLKQITIYQWEFLAFAASVGFFVWEKGLLK